MGQTTTLSTHEGLVMIFDLAQHPIHTQSYRDDCKRVLDEEGVLVLSRFLTTDTVKLVTREAEQSQYLAYYTVSDHNAYLQPSDAEFDDDHPRNRRVSSSKGCITTDQIPGDSTLHVLYADESFKDFLCAVLGEQAMYEYADPLSSINLHYAAAGQELGWHYDNSSFAITLLIQKPQSGAVFEYVKDVRDADRGEMNYTRTGRILAGEIPVKSLSMNAGDLVLFRGRNSIHRVTPTEGDVTRLLVVLAYNTQPGIALSESARMTFYGRLG